MILQSRISQIQDEISAVGSDVDALKVLSRFSLLFSSFSRILVEQYQERVFGFDSVFISFQWTSSNGKFCLDHAKNEERTALYGIFNFIYNLATLFEVWICYRFCYKKKKSCFRRDDFIGQMLELNAKIRLASIIKIVIVKFEMLGVDYKLTNYLIVWDVLGCTF